MCTSIDTFFVLEYRNRRVQSFIILASILILNPSVVELNFSVYTSSHNLPNRMYFILTQTLLGLGK
ncbi:unnamed protein product, partial [Vitis vinifera]